MSLEVNEHREHAEHGAHDAFIGRVSITIAALAAVTAIVNSLEQVETAAAITKSSEAVLQQAKASDQWAFYQSKSVKKHIYGLAADQGGPNADRYRQTAAKEGKDGEKLQEEARGLEAERDALNAKVAVHEQRHHRLAIGATLLEIGIAIATVAIITRRNLWWLASIAFGVGGSVLAAGAYAGYGLF